MCRVVHVNDVFEKAWKGRDPFEEAERLEGEVFRKVKTRRTFRFELDGKGYFAKVHHGVGWREIFKNLSQGKRPVLGARNEYEALTLLHKIGVDTMTPCIFGERGFSPAARDSFLITEELVGMTSLEDFCREPLPFPTRTAILLSLAGSVRMMHRAGLNHRDCYLCHFLLDPKQLELSPVPLHVIDLHRAEIRDQVPFRYLVKDVAGIFFSAMDAGLHPHDLYRFMREYSGRTLRETLKRDAKFWKAVDRAARKLYQKEHGKPAPLFFNKEEKS